ncbi:hypothetical protein BC830DRAFT_1157299 [Chytriomyces sp. MP71]|nr:hypothetical protein BC830DRAFT_1157299 [Chytriomyces sp. MP71]
MAKLITSESEFNEFIESDQLTVVDFTVFICSRCSCPWPSSESLYSRFCNLDAMKQAAW